MPLSVLYVGALGWVVVHAGCERLTTLQVYFAAQALVCVCDSFAGLGLVRATVGSLDWW